MTYLCYRILRVTRLFSSVSTDIMVSLMHDKSDLLPDLLLQITGIFGVKAYRCLGNARFVPVLMALLQIANSTLTVNDLVQLHGIRGLSGAGLIHNYIMFFCNLAYLSCRPLFSLASVRHAPGRCHSHFRGVIFHLLLL